MITTTYSYAREGLIGNPSNSYFGKTFSTIGYKKMKLQSFDREGLKQIKAEWLEYISPERL